MPRFESDSDARRLGDALAHLRRERGLSQAEAGHQAGMTSQGWGLYESGKRPGLFRPDVQRRLTTALGSTPEALALQLRSPAGSVPSPASGGLESPGRSFVPGPGLSVGATRHLQLSNDDLAPWAASGVVLAYEPGRWPRRGQGCVVETSDGSVVVRLYEGADGDVVIVRDRPAGLEQRLLRTDIRSLSAVTARLET